MFVSNWGSKVILYMGETFARYCGPPNPYTSGLYSGKLYPGFVIHSHSFKRPQGPIFIGSFKIGIVYTKRWLSIYDRLKGTISYLLVVETTL